MRKWFSLYVPTTCQSEFMVRPTTLASLHSLFFGRSNSALIRRLYRVDSQLLTMTVQLNVSYDGNKHDHSDVDTLKHTRMCPIYLYDWTLNDHAYCHNKTHITE